jgi:peptidoglycan/xylan/chitin deacetylase (PgdA/CDA1 family)
MPDIKLSAVWRHAVQTTMVFSLSAHLALAAPACERPLYLTFDTGHMGEAPLIADILRRTQVHATFFVANEPTKTGDGTLGNQWGTWWKVLAAEGHEFASQTYDHVYWRADVPGTQPRFRVRVTSGAFADREFTMDTAKYCEQISRAAQRLEDFIGRKTLPLYRAPGGLVSPRLLVAAGSCGFAHVGWSQAGVLGDDLPSEKFSNDVLLKKALRDVRSGDILVAHLGSWKRLEPWAPNVLEPLINGLKQQGFCFETMRNHPEYREWIAAHSR